MFELENMNYQKDFLNHSDLYDKLSENDLSILVNKQFITLQGDKKAVLETDEIEITGRKVSCSSVWCPCCFVKKGGSQRFAERLALLNYKATRQVILTIDPKKFKNGQECYETLKDSGAIHQFVHNLERTSKVKIKDWVWVLEWHKNGFPHWHLFIETSVGKNGKIGNEVLLKHWHYGLVRESYIKSQIHWDRFTKYFAENGYFNPRFDKTVKDKSHQLELPEWAKHVSYKIRKTGSKTGVKKKKEDDQEEKLQGEQKLQEEQEEKEPVRSRETGKDYKTILENCGQQTSCYICRGWNNQFSFVLDIPYKEFLKNCGNFIPGFGYVVSMKLKEFFSMLTMPNQISQGELTWT